VVLPEGPGGRFDLTERPTGCMGPEHEIKRRRAGVRRAAHEHDDWSGHRKTISVAGRFSGLVRGLKISDR
jgi:hypothetical protein